MSAYYNEIDHEAAAWLRELIKAGEIAPGIVDERSIEDVRPVELMDYTQCHFFAGIGVWSRALRQAGWPDSRRVWTGSCPCQPFSAAGKGKGFADERHLWPAFQWLIQQCRPPVVFGEQVAGKAGVAWLDLVQTDVEATGYASGAATFPACSIGAPHQRQRLYWVADAGCEGLEGHDRHGDRSSESRWQQEDKAGPAGPSGGLGESRSVHTTNGFWRDADWLGCRDGKFRPVEPGTFPLADESSSELVRSCDLGPQDVASTKEARQMRIKGYGNAIVAEQAQVFIETCMEVI